MGRLVIVTLLQATLEGRDARIELDVSKVRDCRVGADGIGRIA